MKTSSAFWFRLLHCMEVDSLVCVTRLIRISMMNFEIFPLVRLVWMTMQRCA